MKHKVKVTVLDKKLYPELQQQYCDNPISGACPCSMWEMNLFFTEMRKEMISGT